MIKVLMVITGGLRRNGICVSQLDYAKKISKTDFQVDFAAVHNDSKEMIEKYKECGCIVYKLPDRRKNLFKYIKALKKLLNSEKYDIIHVHGSSALMFIELLIAKKCKVKVRIAHSRNTKCDRPLIDKILRPIFYSSFNYALACGTDAGKWLFNKKKFNVFFNGKDLEQYKFKGDLRKEYREKLHLKNDEIAFGNVGTFYEQKNHLFLIDVYNKIYENNKKSKLFLMGEGILENKIREKVSKYGLENNVIFLGRVSNVNDFLNAMDCMLFPSLFEGLPNVVLEWQINGLTSIISNTITDECIVTDFVKSIPINQGTKTWTDFVKKIKIDTLKLEEYYKECLKKEGIN